MELTDLGEFLDAPKLTLVIRGKKFVVEAADAERWLRLQTIATGYDTGERVDASVLDLFKLSLGPTFDEMVKAKLTGPEIQHAGTTAFYWQLSRDDLASAFWQSGGKAPKAATPKRSTGTATAAGTTTRRRASGTTTTSRSSRKA